MKLDLTIYEAKNLFKILKQNPRFATGDWYDWLIRKLEALIKKSGWPIPEWGIKTYVSENTKSTATAYEKEIILTEMIPKS